MTAGSVQCGGVYVKLHAKNAHKNSADGPDGEP